jgi:hypothetical protein
VFPPDQNAVQVVYWLQQHVWFRTTYYRLATAVWSSWFAMAD